MMLPGWQLWPPKSLTPSILGSEPPLFCVDPPCFLDALENGTSRLSRQRLYTVKLSAAEREVGGLTSALALQRVGR